MASAIFLAMSAVDRMPHVTVDAVWPELPCCSPVSDEEAEAGAEAAAPTRRLLEALEVGLELDLELDLELELELELGDMVSGLGGNRGGSVPNRRPRVFLARTIDLGSRAGAVHGRAGQRSSAVQHSAAQHSSGHCEQSRITGNPSPQARGSGNALRALRVGGNTHEAHDHTTHWSRCECGERMARVGQVRRTTSCGRSAY